MSEYFFEDSTTPPTYAFQDTAVQPVSPDVAEQRAKKYSLAMGPDSPGTDQLMSNILSGSEQADRDYMVYKKQLAERQTKLDLLDALAQDTGGKMDAHTVDFVMGMSSEDMASPDTIMEKLYSRKAINNSLLADDNPTFTDGLIQNPPETHKALDGAEAMVAKKESAQRLLEDAQARYNGQSWAGWAVDTAVSLVPGVAWWRGNTAVEGAPNSTGGGLPDLPGTSLRAQFDYLNFLPVDQSYEELKKATDGMNPQDAVAFLSKYLDYSSSSAVIDNLLIAGTDAATVASPALKMLTGASKVAKVAEIAANVAKSEKEIAPVIREAVQESARKKEIRLFKEYRQTMSDEEAYKRAREEALSETQKPTVQAAAENLAETAYNAATATPEQMTRKGIRDVVMSLFKPRTTPEAVLDAAGHTEQAATQGAISKLRILLRKRTETAGGGGYSALVDTAPMLFKTQQWLDKGSVNFSNELQRRIIRAVQSTAPQILEALTGGLRIGRLPESPGMIEAMVNQAKEGVKTQYPHLADNIVGARPFTELTPSGDVYKVGVQFGDEDAVLFKTKNAAQRAAEKEGYKEYRIGQQGSGFYVEVSKTVDETDPLIRNLLIETDNQTPRSYANMFFGLLRTPEDKLSKLARQDRKAAVYGVGELTNLVRASAERIGALPKKARRELFEFVENDRVYETTVTHPNGQVENQVGRMANSLQEFENRFYETHGHYPSEGQAVAYLEYQRLNELDWAFRNFRLYRDKARLGIERFDLTHVDNLKAEKVVTPLTNIEGKTVKEIPVQAAADAGILILKDGEPQFLSKNANRELTQKTLDEYLAKGFRIIQVSPFGERSLLAKDLVHNVVGENRIHYVLTDKMEVRPLSVRQLPNKPGGHIEYPDGFFMAQPKIARLPAGHRYDGDTNIMFFTNQAKAQKYAKALDDVRQMLKNGADDAAIDALIGRTLPKDPGAIRALFKPKLDEGGKVLEPARLHLDDPISVRASGQRLGDTLNLKNRYANWSDSSEDPYNLFRDLNLDYTGMRNSVIETVEESGSEARPIFKTKPAKLVDAMSTLNRAVKDMLDARFLDDVKTKEVESWVQEFGHLLNVDPTELKRNPLKYVYNTQPLWNESADRLEVMAAKNSLQSLKQFLGTSTQFSQNLRWVKQKVLNSIYTRFGDKGLDIAEPLLMYTTNDPVKYARSLAFHMKLGLFNPVQIFLQAQTFTHMAGVAGPKIAMKAGPAAFLMRGLRFTNNEEIIDKFATYATKFGWNKQDFKEAYLAMRESGMDRVAGEVAMRDDVYDPQLVQTAMGKFADWSTFFFNEGERFTRTSGYGAAYLEWRAANPGKLLDNAAKKSILERADLLSGNMTRASNASWQRGFASIPTQFFAYQARIAEQLLGKRLTGAEKMRVLGMYSLVYGVPVAASAGTAVWPWGDTLRKQLMANGIDYDENVITKGLVDGFASVALETMTGVKTNFGERYGPGGLDAFRDWLTGTKDGAELLLGVAGSSIGDVVSATWPIVGDVADIFGGTNDAYPLLVEDMVDATKEISSANNFLKMLYGMNYGKYITKNEMYMTDVTPINSLMMGLAGLTPQEVSDAFTKQDILKDLDAAQTDAAKDAIKYIRRGLRAGDPTEREANFSRAKSLIVGSGMDIKHQSDVYSQAMRGWQSFVDATNWKFAKSSPERLQQYIQDSKK